ncbi:MAG TPA: OmpA family protein [Oligoflexia bacterium]|nr:OmpA family protein [Oligoflexia bacterium]HMP27507.1 OmpA family protein [Oligoflexia bacterium]
MKKNILLALFCLCSLELFVAQTSAQEFFPEDNGIYTYHTAPRYREAESHPLRVLAYIFHPIGWVAREAIFRPLSYFASSTNTRRSVMGYRDPYDFRETSCFSSDDAAPDCRSVLPYNYMTGAIEENAVADEPAAKWATESWVSEKEILFPSINFDRGSFKLNSLGEERVKQVAEMLAKYAKVMVVVEGHTDDVGSEDANYRMGLKRAETVQNALIDSGVDATRLTVVSYGSSRPLMEGKDEWSRAANRRVEVKQRN